MKRLLRHPGVLAWGAWALAAYLRFALRTTRWTLLGREQMGPYWLGGGAIYAFWHERLPMMPALWTRSRDERASLGRRPGGMHVLVSRHQDGRMIGAAMRAFGLSILHGSRAKGTAQKGGAAGVRAMLAVLAAGDQVVITPDGPRGPPRVSAPGVAQVAALAGAPVFACAAASTRSRALPTWDGMRLPLPFGRGVLVVEAPILVPRQGWEASLPRIEAALTAAADRADQAVPR